MLGLTKTSLSEDVYAIIKKRIQTRQLKPGDRIILREFATDFGVSITPIQQALGRLDAEGLIKFTPRKGGMVVGLTGKNIIDILDTRILIETHAAVEAIKLGSLQKCEKRFNELITTMESLIKGDDYIEYDKFVQADTEFHRSLVVEAGNEKLLELYDYLDSQMKIVRYFYTKSKKARRVQNTMQEHRNIFVTIVNSDTEQIKVAITEHLTKTKNAVSEEALIV